MEIPLLQDIVIILGSSVLIILLFQKFKVPSILGFLTTGILAGPYGLSLIHGVHEVELMAEIGIIFLLFVIGIEFSLKGLSSIKRTILIGGTIQVGGTILVTAAACHLIGLPWNQGVFVGFLFSLSSTAIVLNLLQSKGEITTPHGRISVAVLIFQDIIVVPMILLTPIIAGQSENVIETLLILLAKFAGILLVIILLARYIVPYILTQVVRTRSRELFILTIIVLCFATAWLTSSVGLSLALGAFFAGLIISESDFSHQATANILPFREIFISFFFVSIGMLLNIDFFIHNVVWIVVLTLVVMIVKASIVALGVFMLKYPFRTILITSFSLFQVGEFAFILSTTGLQYDLLSDEIYQYFLSISILSMAVTPFIFNSGPVLYDRLMRSPISRRVRDRFSASNGNGIIGDVPKDHEDHLVIIGYGINGKNVSRAAKNANIPYIIVELNPTTVEKMKREGEPIIFGDATQDLILHHVHIHKARVVVIAISDPDATKKIVSQVRMHTQTAHVIVRTRYVKEIDENLKLGADEVIPEEFETSIEIFSKVLTKYLIPNDQIQAFVYQIRSQNYDMLRNVSNITSKPLPPIEIPEVSIVALPVQQEKNKIVGQSISEAGIREAFNVNVLAIKRQDGYITPPDPGEKILQDDIIYVFGDQKNITELNKFLTFQ